MVREDFWVTNGAVTATALSGNTLYLAGDFTKVAPASGGFVPFDATTAAPVPGFPKVAGSISAAVSDGSGGWFIGGHFSAVGGVPRRNLAHILSDQSVAPWNPEADATVYALALSGTTVLVGGEFGHAGGQARNFFAAIDASTGLATSWSPAVGGHTVLDIATDDTHIYVGSLLRISSYDAATGTRLWFTETNGPLYALERSGTTLYAGGSFSNVGGQNREAIAALDASTGAVTPWNANANTNEVYAIAVQGATVYAEGGFTQIGGQPRNGIAALDASTGLATSWNPIVDFPLGAATTSADLAANATTVYAGGPTGILAIDASTGLVTRWNPNVNGDVTTIVLGPGTVYVGGGFASFGGLQRTHFAAIDVTTGRPNEWNPEAAGDQYFGFYGVNTLAVSGRTVYAAGDFTTIGGQPRNHLAALDATTARATPWDPNPVSLPFVLQDFALAATGTTVYVVGPFSSIGGQPRNQIAALDAVTGLATAWNPSSDIDAFGNPYSSALAVSGTTVYIAGPFSTIGGQPRYSMAALDAATGLATAWNPNPDGFGRPALVVSGSLVYAAGSFTQIGGQARNRLAALDATTGLATGWNPNPGSDPIFGGDPRFASVVALSVSGTTVYVGGRFASIGGQPRNNIAALDAGNGTALDWDPNASGGLVSELCVGGGAVYAGGEFTAMNNGPQSHIAAIEAIREGPDCGHARAVPSRIWESDHRPLVPVRIAGVTGPNREPLRIRVTSVTQDEPLEERRSRSEGDDDSVIGATEEASDLDAEHDDHRGGRHDGRDKCPDAVIDRRGGVSLRAERSARGNGRVYTVWFTATDRRGASCGGSVQVCVPRDRRHLACVDDGQDFNSLGPCPRPRHEYDLDEVTEVTLTAESRIGNAGTIEYALPEASDVSIAVFDVAGRRVTTLEHGLQEAGIHEVAWNTSGVANGMYFYRLQAGAVRVTRSVLIVK